MRTSKDAPSKAQAQRPALRRGTPYPLGRVVIDSNLRLCTIDCAAPTCGAVAASMELREGLVRWTLRDHGSHRSGKVRALRVVGLEEWKDSAPRSRREGQNQKLSGGRGAAFSL